MDQQTSTDRAPRQLTAAFVALVVASTALAGACGGGPQLEASVDTMIELEATWQCDVVRFSYDSVAEIDSMRDRTRGRFGVSADDHRIFTDMMEDDAELRAAVAARNDELCPVVES